MLVTCVNPAIGSGSMLPSIAKLYVWADWWRAMPNLLDSSLKDSSFPRPRRLKLAIMPLLFIAVLLEWHIFIITASQQGLKCKVASSAVASKLIYVPFSLHYSWTPVGATHAWFHLVLCLEQFFTVCTALWKQILTYTYNKYQLLSLSLSCITVKVRGENQYTSKPFVNGTSVF